LEGPAAAAVDEVGVVAWLAARRGPLILNLFAAGPSVSVDGSSRARFVGLVGLAGVQAGGDASRGRPVGLGGCHEGDFGVSRAASLSARSRARRAKISRPRACASLSACSLACRANTSRSHASLSACSRARRATAGSFQACVDKTASGVGEAASRRSVERGGSSGVLSMTMGRPSAATQNGESRVLCSTPTSGSVGGIVLGLGGSFMANAWAAGRGGGFQSTARNC
jgi:hypothetical protein